ncbi:MAG: alanine racemase [Clostridia bacterium]|nr:alanine racemase [Clostridia bacterium]
MRKVKAEIYLKSIQENAKTFKALTGARLCAVVKANAYGHGAEEVVNALAGIADCFAVALKDEAIALRTAACDKDILILTPPLCEEDIVDCAKNGFIVTLPDLFTARLAVRVCKRYSLTLRAHLKVNTGMNRYGMHNSMLGKTCKLLKAERCVRAEGVYSHLYTCKKEISENQRALFCRAERIFKGYFPQGIAHLSATYGATLGTTFAFDMVRIGIGLYGYLPAGAQGMPLKKAMRITAQVVTSRKYLFGGAGYGDAEKTLEGKRICVCRYGYADGFLRSSQNGVDGYDHHAGALCMDACLRLENGRRGENVTVLSDAEATGKAAGTIAYETLCAATRRAEMCYVWE